MEKILTALVIFSAVFVAGCTSTPSNSSGSSLSGTTITTTSTAQSTTYILADVAKHSTASDCWIAIDNSVYDVTKYIPQHPNTQIEQGCGKDASAMYAQQRKHQGPQAQTLLPEFKIGVLKV